MINFERKNINNKPFYYLTEQINLGKKFKKISVFVGKNIPKDTNRFYDALKGKERELLQQQIAQNQFKSKYLEQHMVYRLEFSRIDWKYFSQQLSDARNKRLLRDFAIQFIFESNAIEGSRLSRDEVLKIALKQYVKKDITRIEIREVLNSIRAFEYIQSDSFTLNQKSIKQLHEIIVSGLNVPTGFKKEKIVVNNKETTDPKKVRQELTRLISWYKKSKGSEHSFVRAIIFHNRFERIHPFTDGNGRVGRMILNWMLMREKYGVILFQNRNKTAYRNALNKGDEGRYGNILKLSLNTYRKTIRDIVAQ